MFINFFRHCVFAGLLLILSVGLFGSHSAFAANTVNPEPAECKASKLNISNLFVLSNNTPILKKECTTDSNGSPRPLSPILLFDVAIRAYAFMVSLAFTIVSPSLVVAGIMYMYSGLDETQNKFLKTWVTNLSVSLLLLIFAYLIPFTILSVLEVELSQTDLKDFFRYN